MKNTLVLNVIRKFKPVFSVQEYQNLLIKYKLEESHSKSMQSDAEEEYWNKLPEYILSKCPICGVEHTDWLDLHSLERGKIALTPYVRSHKDGLLYRSCEHQVVMTTFLHLNGNKPDSPIYLEAEVPYLTTFLFPKEIEESYAVINALPVCRIENNQFIPTYTLFFLKYYGRDWKAVRYVHRLPESNEYYSRPFLYTVDQAWEHRKDKVFDLEYWVEQGRLFWLDEENGKAVLRNNPTDFPYKGIEGYVDKLVFQNGEMHVVGHDNPPRYYPTWKPEDWTKKQVQRRHSQRYRVPLPSARYLLIILAFISVLAIVTSLFFRPIIDPFVAWVLMLLALGTAAYFTFKASYQPYKDGQITRRAFARNAVIDLLGLLLTTGAAILAGGWTIQVVGLLILRVTNLAWLGIVIGMLAGFAAGFGVARLVRWLWRAIFKRERQSSTASK